MRDECWHPECYLIHKVCDKVELGYGLFALLMMGSHSKFWNVKVVRSSPHSPDTTDPPYVEEERQETHTSLKEKPIKMEQLVYRIWT